MSERGFKVVDRRRFTAEGDEREGVEDVVESPTPATKPEASSTSAPTEQAAPTPDPAPQPDTQPDTQPEAAADEFAAEGGLTFAMFTQSLAQQCMMQLGLVPWPHTGQRGLQLEQARDTIDVLEIMSNKTQGNLSASEKQMLDTVLYELRMTYVEINNQLAQAAMEGAGGPGGPGGPQGPR